MEETHVKLGVPLSDDVITLSPLDQQAQRAYFRYLVIFSLDAAKSRDGKELTQDLKLALGVALSEIPDFAAVVAPIPGTTRKELELRLDPESGVTVFTVDHATLTTSPLHHETFASLEAAGFRLTDLPPDALFAPQPSPSDTTLTQVPAMLVQLNLVPGGLIMGLAWHHGVGSVHAANTFVSSWARHAKTLLGPRGTLDAPDTPTEVALSRWRFFHGVRDATASYIPGYLVDAAMRSPEGAAALLHLLDREGPVPATATPSTWYFSAEALQALQSHLATASDEKFTPSEAVVALVWKHLSQARQLHERMPEGTLLLAARLDFANQLKPPLGEPYIGNATGPDAAVSAPVSEVCEDSMASTAALAGKIRSSVAALDESSMRTFISFVQRAPAPTHVARAYAFPGPNLVVVDLSGMDALRQDWGGPLGHPACVRLGMHEKGLTYVLPQDKEGGFEVHLECEEEAAGRLRVDPVFMQYASLRH